MTRQKYCILFSILLPFAAVAQTTTGSISGMVKTNTGEPLTGAGIKAMHEPTGTLYFSQAGKTGNFIISNLLPGGPYTIEVSFINYDTARKKDLLIGLGENNQQDFLLAPHSITLQQVTVATTQKNRFTANGGTLNQEKIALLPTTGSNLSDYLRAVPQVRLIQGNEGAISVAGQNNRYNSFYVDGALNNDVFGLAASGTNGGQAGVSPLSIDAVDQFQLAVSPYDVSLGNFTGAAINAVTRAGSNRNESSFYHFLSNRNTTGKTPEDTRQGNVTHDDFYIRLYGFRTQGAITKNKVFYFSNIELQREVYAQPFSFAQYKGNTKDIGLIQILSNTLRATYHYNAGTFIDNPESVNADRIVTRVDWNINKRNSLSVSNRYTYGQRINTNASNENTIHFSNDGYALYARTNSISVELKTSTSHRTANKLLITYTAVKDDREPLQKAFPRVRINDGGGAFIFGTDNSSTINLLTQKNWTLFDKYSFTWGNHALSTGTDMEYNRLFNAFIQNSFGNYTYASLGDFLTNGKPSAYQLGFSMMDTQNSDHTAASARISALKIAAFINDEIRQGLWILSYGLRIDHHRFLNTPAADDYTNTIAIPAFAQYWDIQNAQSGAGIQIPLCVSPRIGFIYKLIKQAITLRGGSGIFSGRLPLAWPGGAYNNNGMFIGGFAANSAQLNRIRFRPDPYHQWTAAELTATINKEPLNLVTEKFSMPRLFRASLALDKKMNNGWMAGLELMFSKNLTEIKYTNINLLPPVLHAAGPDNRNIYGNTNNGKIPLNADGSNPYDYVILLGTNKKNTGYAYNLAATASGRLRSNWVLDMHYHFGYSAVNNEGTSSVNLSQWRFMETVNGRNFITRSVSDFSAGHTVFMLLHKTFRYPVRSMKTTVSLAYTGQSGTPVSYVYGNISMTSDDGFFGAYDLLYIPSVNDLAAMIFLPNTINTITHSPEQQKAMFENYIQQDAYLRTRRGRYAERNGSRTPFTNIVDMKITHTIRIKQYQVQLTCDIFNITNLLNNNWGRRYYEPNDNIAILDFAGYVSPGNLTPQYRFNPSFLYEPKWHTSTSTIPAFSTRWSAQFGIRITF